MSIVRNPRGVHHHNSNHRNTTRAVFLNQRRLLFLVGWMCLVTAGARFVLIILPLLRQDPANSATGFITKPQRPKIAPKFFAEKTDHQGTMTFIPPENGDNNIDGDHLPTYYQPPDPSENPIRFPNYAQYEDTNANNPTVFGQLLRGELPARFFATAETTRLVAFRDIHPRADFHALIIPKHPIPSVLELTPSDQDLLGELSDTAHALLQTHMPEAYRRKDYRLCFHVPPFNSVDHLHLHVLAPVSTMAGIYRNGKYHTGRNRETATGTEAVTNFSVRWCTGLGQVGDRLARGLPATVWSRDEAWTTTMGAAVASVWSILRAPPSVGGSGGTSV